MAYHQTSGHTAASPNPAGTTHSVDAARWQRVNQAQYLEEKLRNGISPTTVASLTALLARLEAHQTLPSMALSIVADVSGYKRTMTCRNGFRLRTTSPIS